ncbi:MAG: ATP-binding protein [Terracidiphilus sp.]|jgi:DNA replication protein DnaC
MLPKQFEYRGCWPPKSAGTHQSGAGALVSELTEARDENHPLRFQKQLVSHELLFESFSQRHERASSLVTSNLTFEEWSEIFGSERLTGARLAHHVHILEMNGDSYRLKQSRRNRTHSAGR